jgi:hypothetical protein
MKTETEPCAGRGAERARDGRSCRRCRADDLHGVAPALAFPGEPERPVERCADARPRGLGCHPADANARDANADCDPVRRRVRRRHSDADAGCQRQP